MRIDHRALENVSVGYNNDSPMYKVHDRTSTNDNKSSSVSCCEKMQSNPPSYKVENTNEESKSSDNFENVYNETQKFQSTGSDNNAEGGINSVHRYNTLILRPNVKVARIRQ